MRLLGIWVCVAVLLLARDEYSDKSWGVGMVGRMDSTPYNCAGFDDTTINNFVPLFYFENDYVYMRGLTYGVKLFGTDEFQLSLLSRIRFLSIPEDLQNSVQGDSLDYGMRGRYFLADNQYVDLELMGNSNDGSLINLTYSSDLVYGDAYLSPYATLSFKDSAFNTDYYGREVDEIDSDFDVTAGFDIKYHVYSNFYLLGGASATYLGSNISGSQMIDEDITYSIYGGVGILNDKKKEFFDVDGMKPYVRIAQGWATVSNLEDILTGSLEEDEYSNTMTSIFYGHPIYKTLFDLPLELYLSTGFTYHHSSEVQDSTWELDLEMKVYYTLPIDGVDIRLGAGEGFSYVGDITYIERLDGEPKGYELSHLNFYLDLSTDIHLDFISESLDGLWLGAAVHHRSSVFEASSLFGRIKGGSNYNTIYLQWHF
ncbi:MAG: MipA/OmpV family protein [Campylobacterota bacterium]|nr:MipA/OmpV family protein [Campylobacterota bacterium]